MTQYLEPLVQKIETVCDLAGLDQLSTAHKKLISEAKKLSRAYARMMTPKERLQLENMSLSKRKYALLLEREKNNISENRLALQRLINTQKIHNNETRIATQNTTRQLSADRVRMAEIRRLTQAERKQTEALRLKNRELQRSQSVYSHLKGIIGSFVGVWTFGSMLDTMRETDLMRRSLTGLTKSPQDWEFIRQQSYRTGTRIEDTSKGYRNFYAAASMAGFEKTSIQGMYGDVLTATRSIGASPQQTAGALLALEQMISKGKVSMEELRRQLGNALPGAFEIGAKAMNMTTAKFNEFVKSGKLASTEFVPKFIAQLKKEFAGGFVESTKSIDFALNNLHNSWVDFISDIGSSFFGQSLARAINSLADLKNNCVGLKTVLKVIGAVLGALIRQVHIILALIAPAIILGIVNSIKKIAQAIMLVDKAMLKVYGRILLVIALLLILQDLWAGIFKFDEIKSVTGAIRNKLTGEKNPLYKPKDKASTDVIAFSNPNVGNIGLNKTQTININAPMTINGGDNPQAIAYSVNEQLVGIIKSMEMA